MPCSFPAGRHTNAAHHRIHAQHKIPSGPQPGCVPRQRHDAGRLLEYPVFGRRLQLRTAEQSKRGHCEKRLIHILDKNLNGISNSRKVGSDFSS